MLQGKVDDWILGGSINFEIKLGLPNSILLDNKITKQENWLQFKSL